MFEINWNILKAKFNGKEQITFENISYLLFCDEFNQDRGIFRYKNQTGIETEPIENEGKIIGFQAKFYETKISDNVKDIEDSIAKAKYKNPNLNKILFYINQEFSESNKNGQKEPQYKIEIDNFAIGKGIEIEWRVPSHFERQLTLENNISLAKHFFALEKSTFDLIQDLSQHTESILTPIRTDIEFKGNVIKLDRLAILADLKIVLAKSPVVILSGKGGIGKTAVIKDFYNQVKETVPVIMFKATEFNTSNINRLFNVYGNFTLTDFIAEYQRIEEKYIIIDSAEKLSDIEDQSTFQEFLSSLINNKWKVIFTTRYSYLDDLKFQLIETYSLSFTPLNIEEISEEELNQLSNKYYFNLPENERLLELLRNPFYLAEYLHEYENIERSTSLTDFKNHLWYKQIAKSVYQKGNIHIRRESCFLQIAQKRANDGHFFVSAEGYDNEALQALEADEIIKYDANAGGYFITHDIYEEWALDKIIERFYISLVDYENFFAALGSSLPVRRSFRSWLSEKLFINQENIKSLIEQSLVSDNIESFWKDEMIVSVLLSDYAGVFFRLFEAKLLENEEALLMRVVFLLRIACKEIDDGFLPTLFTQPKGSGWSYVIDFIHSHKEMLGNKHMPTILPMLVDWNNKNTHGDTTKKASQIALFYYENIVSGSGFGKGEVKDQLIRVILQGSAEIKEELIRIFDGILNRNEPNHRDRDYKLVEVILTSITDSYEVIKVLPGYVIKLAELFWVHRPRKDDDWFGYRTPGIEEKFGLSHGSNSRYFPPSALQTPIYQLLRCAPNITINFILTFTNKAAENYASSELKYETEEIEVLLIDNSSIKQYISNRLWNTYRGTQVSTHLLESMHMAVEKWLLDYAKVGTPEQLENLCYYLIKNSHSASVTAVVASIVMAHPSKLFNIAKILFRTKEFFYYDTKRMVLESSVKATCSIGYGFNYKHDIHSNERIKTCDDPHRKKTLEFLAIEYQFFRSADVSAEEAEKRQQFLWGIFDGYYKELQEISEETEDSRTWRLYLARMDRRKMSPELETTEEGVLINFNPQIDPEFKKYSEDSRQQYNDAYKHMPLYLWSRHRFDNEKDKYCQYRQYENNPQSVIAEVEEIIQTLKKGETEDFRLFNHATPAYACSILVRDFNNLLNTEEMEFCKDIIVEYSSLPLWVERYIYQVTDGIEPAICALPHLFNYFSKDKEVAGGIKAVLTALLLSIHTEISTFTARAILQNLWDIGFEDAHSIFLGYLYLKPKYDSLIDEIHKENYSKGIYEISDNQVLEIFDQKYEDDLEKIISYEIKYDDIPDIQKMDLDVLTRAFELLPLGTQHDDHNKFVLEIFPVFAERIFERDRYHNDEERFDYKLKTRFLDKFAAFVLTADKKLIDAYIKPFVENFKVADDTDKFFQHFISAEDRLNRYEEFWMVWHLFYENIKAISTRKHYYHDTRDTIYNYLLAWPYWTKTAKEWHSLKGREKLFYKKASEDMGHFPPVLYSISKVLNEIGSNFLEDGIFWLSNMVEKNKNLLSEELEVNTIYYLENIVRKYVLTYRQRIKTTLHIKKAVISILNFLVERGSATGYLLRENIL
ncbi:AVAST type 4 anti-phage nuclease Avs4 [Desulforamulus aeronauticus]|uniref:ATPase family associated with various cellular activities (AAA) n=1 Tax=Desulforamulus aeronauticus DSM 10349 TaxID=1121421 RepID=A0A1M6Q4F6_9FIRM|nr:AVAST type 4 anti-phage nuclease Avs4 [Desulforamulus aeronauticus]SHK15139.1 hypothetical protein SAMN02745123_00899 [Desulforamulus aeronauticus DSM 10349]